MSLRPAVAIARLLRVPHIAVPIPRSRILPPTTAVPCRRWNSTAIPPNTPPAAAGGNGSPPATAAAPAAAAAEQKPSYHLTFTCRPCQTRSTHVVSKQAYHGGTVLIQCPGCKNRHVITDHLKIFGETARSLEDILKENGEVLQRARLLENGDMELLPAEDGDGEEPKSLA